ncbi:MAG TPA: DNA-binding response regulator [Alphaproteobacteria bacterium]|nr:DNA-binding response regulator [Alphaproteobacteria bacterium]
MAGPAGTALPAHILVIDDDERLRDLLQRFLAESDFLVTVAGSAEEARAYLVGMAFDLLVIDVMMPGETGVEFLADLRKTSEVPALFLTAMSETEDRITGLETGADDYISKPFEPRELTLRIRRILDRQAMAAKPSMIQFGPFSYDTDRQVLSENGRRVHITTAEQDLLGCFTAAANQILSRDDISDRLAGRMKGRSIDVAVARLRTKLEQDPRFPVFLQTVRGRGWMLRTN